MAEIVAALALFTLVLGGVIGATIMTVVCEREGHRD